MQRSINYRTVGASVKLTARVGAEDAVVLSLNVQETKIRPPEGGEEANVAGGAPSFELGTLATQVTVPAGKSVTAQAVRTEGKSGGSISLVIVTAHVIDSRRPMN
jgi:type II secretory pathway component GspD/PulD (secretin)